MMITTDKKIIDIAWESGFGSLGQFYAFFKRVTGQSPARYRRALRGGGRGQ
jgi:AraC-like DNA-binding protein